MNLNEIIHTQKLNMKCKKQQTKTSFVNIKMESYGL
jgi:hypothetical protein